MKFHSECFQSRSHGYLSVSNESLHLDLPTLSESYELVYLVK